MSAWDEWQRRLRSEKEEERKKKTESEEILRGYRGGVAEEDMKLQALRQDDRKKKQDALRMLEQYRGQDEVALAGAASRRNSRQPGTEFPYPPVNADHQEENIWDQISPGSVAGLAASFSGGLNFHESPKSQKSSRSLGNLASPEFFVVDHGSALDNEMCSTPAVTALVDQFSRSDEKKLEDAPTNGHSTRDYSNSTTVASNTIDFSSADYSTRMSNDILLTNAAQANNVLEGVANESHHGLDSSDAASSLKPTEASSSPSRLDILFSFGLVTTMTEPSLDCYMRAVDQVTQWTLMQNPSLSNKVSYNSASTPSVTDFHWDGKLLQRLCQSDIRDIHSSFCIVRLEKETYVDSSNRLGVKRAVITASLPIFVLDQAFDDEVKQKLISAFRASVETGTFVQLAHY